MSEDQRVPISRPRRRWFQFSLQTLLLVVALIGGLLTWVSMQINRVRTQRATIAAVRAARGAPIYDFELVVNDRSEAAVTVREGRQPPGPEWLRNLLGIDYFASLAGAGLIGGATDDTLKHVGLQKSLLVIWLHGNSQVTDSGLEHISELPDLRELSLYGSPAVTDAGVAHICRLMELRSLYLDVAHMSDAGLAPLKKLKKLRFLNLEKSRVTREAVDDLRKSLPNCTISGGASASGENRK